MTDESKPPESQEVPAAPEPKGRGKLLRGCGCLFGLCVLGLGILIIGNFDSTSWASALIAITVGFLTFQLSGVNGMWEDK
jgi:hypothetical protein